MQNVRPNFQDFWRMCNDWTPRPQSFGNIPKRQMCLEWESAAKISPL